MPVKTVQLKWHRMSIPGNAAEHGPSTPACGRAWTLSKIAMSFVEHGTRQAGFARCKQMVWWLFFFKLYLHIKIKDITHQDDVDERESSH